MFLPLLSACQPDPVQEVLPDPVHLDQDSEDQEDPTTSVVVQQSSQADVLIVLDTSPGMEPYWTRAGEGAGDMLQHLLGKGHSIHVGVITTDEVAVDLVASEDDLVRALTDHVPQGQHGVRDAIAAARTEPANVDFFRPGVDLEILVITAEEDPSEMDNAELLSLLGQADLHGLLSADAVSLHELVLAAGGLSEDVESLEYGDFLSALGATIEQEGLIDHIALPSVPEPDSISVSVDGFPWMGQFGLSADGRTLYLVDLPPPGFEIRVDYLAAVTPPG
jgi:hypothetical protein